MFQVATSYVVNGVPSGSTWSNHRKAATAAKAALRLQTRVRSDLVVVVRGPAGQVEVGNGWGALACNGMAISAASVAALAAKLA